MKSAFLFYTKIEDEIRQPFYFLHAAVGDLSASADIGRSDDGCSRFGISSSADTFCVAVGDSFDILCSASLGYTITGPQGRQERSQTLSVANAAAADTGVYTCDSGPPCNDRQSFTVNVVRKLSVESCCSDCVLTFTSCD